MIIIDKALEERHSKKRPIRVALVGAGYMGRGIALQIVKFTKGMRLVAIYNRNILEAKRAFQQSDIEDVITVESVERLEDAINNGQSAITDNASLLCEAQGIDAIVEVTGTVEFGAQIVLKAIENKIKRDHKIFLYNSKDSIRLLKQSPVKIDIKKIYIIKDR